MKIHEYQAKKLLGDYGAPVPSGIVAETAEAARQAAEKMLPCVIKAQVHSGGRGKAGGVKLAKTADEAETIARQMLGMRLVTKQTGAEGKIVHKVLVTEAVAVKKEYYLSVTGDMNRAGLVIVASGAGGTEIAETAKTAPEAISTTAKMRRSRVRLMLCASVAPNAQPTAPTAQSTASRRQRTGAVRVCSSSAAAAAKMKKYRFSPCAESWSRPAKSVR